jgi:hypothetical protein
LTPAELLKSRAELLLGEAERQGKGPSFHHLDEIATRSLPELSPEDRRAAVAEAQRIANRNERVAPPPGYKPSAKANGAPKKVAARNIQPSTEADWTPARLREFTRKRLEADPKLTAGAIYEEAQKLGGMQITFSTFATSYHNAARRTLGIGGVGRKHVPGGPGGRPRTAEMRAALGIRDSNEPQTSPAAELPTAPEPVATDSPQTSIAPPPVAVATPEVPHSLSSVPGLGLIEISGGGDSFRACRRTDGGWDVELRAHVDADVMDRLAGVLYGRIVGRAMEARA